MRPYHPGKPPYAGISYLYVSQVRPKSCPPPTIELDGALGEYGAFVARHAIGRGDRIRRSLSGEALWLTTMAFCDTKPEYVQTGFLRFRSFFPRARLSWFTEQIMTTGGSICRFRAPCVSYYEDEWDRLVCGCDHWLCNYARRAVSPVGESANDFDIYKGLCERLGRGEAWADGPHECCRQIPGDSSRAPHRNIDLGGSSTRGRRPLRFERALHAVRDMAFRNPSCRIEAVPESIRSNLGEEVLVLRGQVECGPAAKREDLSFTLITYKHVHSTHSHTGCCPLYSRATARAAHGRSRRSMRSAATYGGEAGAVVQMTRGSFVLKASLSNHRGQTGTAAMPQGWSQKIAWKATPPICGHIPGAKRRQIRRNQLSDLGQSVRRAQEVVGNLP